MSRFISEKTKRINLNDTEWIDVKESISYEQLLPITKLIDPNNSFENAKAAIPILEIAINSWNFKDDDGKDVECTKENIKNLDSRTVLELLPILTDLYFPQKKN